MLAVRWSASAQTVPSVPPRASSRLRNRSSATPNAALTASQPSAESIAVRRMAEEHRDDRDEDQQVASGYTSASATPSGAAPLSGRVAQHEVPERHADTRDDHPRVERELPAVRGAPARGDGQERRERQRIDREEEGIGGRYARGAPPASARARAPACVRRWRPPPPWPAAGALVSSLSRATSLFDARQNSATSASVQRDEQRGDDCAADARTPPAQPEPEQVGRGRRRWRSPTRGAGGCGSAPEGREEGGVCSSNGLGHAGPALRCDHSVV